MTMKTKMQAHQMLPEEHELLQQNTRPALECGNFQCMV